MPDPTAADIFNPPTDRDPETGLPLVELPADIEAAFVALGWRVVPSNIEHMYVEHDLVLDHVDPDGRVIGSLGYSIEPSGHQSGLVVHRGDNCDGPVLVMRPHTPAGIPPSVVVAAVAALKAHDVAEIGRPCPAGGLVTVLDRVIPDDDDHNVTYDAVCSTCGTVGTDLIRHRSEEIAAGHRAPPAALAEPVKD